MARILVVGSGEDASALAGALEGANHVVGLVPSVERNALEHVAIVCWLEGASPERFLSRAIDSTMRGFVYRPGGSEHEPQSVRAVMETASRNSIPVAMLKARPEEGDGWLDEARAAVEGLLSCA